MEMAPQLGPLMNPRSVAVVGASVREDAGGTVVVRNLQAIGFEGPVYPVNPRYAEVGGLTCYSSLKELPGKVDAVFIALPAQQGPAVLQEAGELGVRAAFISASGYADGDAAGKVLQAEVQRIAREYGIAVSGPNNTGIVNLHDRVAMSTSSPMKSKAGPVAILTQSGSAALVLREDTRNLGFGYVVTAGNEAVVTASDYLEYLIADERIRVVIMFLETIRDPGRFAAAAAKARRTGKRLLTLKVGRSAVGRASVMAHTGSLAGDDQTYDAFFRKHGVVRVADFDELIEAAVLFSAYPFPPPTPHVVPITLSGGEAALIADLATATDVSIPEFSASTRDRIRAALPAFSQSARNPLDAYGLNWDPQRFSAMISALLDDKEIGVIVPAVDAPASGGADADWACEMATLLADLAPTTLKRFVIFNNAANLGVDRRLASILTKANIPCLTGMRESLVALGHWTHFDPAPPADDLWDEKPVSAGRRALLASRGNDEALFKALRTAGIPTAECALVTSAEAAVKAAAEIGYPVALKGSAPSVAHKAKLGLVRLNLVDDRAVRDAFADIVSAMGKANLSIPPGAILVQSMAPAGMELIIGIRNDPQFGTVVVAGSGGTKVEACQDVSVRLGPLSRTEALEMLQTTAAGRLLTGDSAGERPYDLDAAVDALVNLSRLGAAARAEVASLEINPLLVFREGVLSVDVLAEFI